MPVVVIREGSQEIRMSGDNISQPITNRELLVMPLADTPRKWLVPAVKVLCCVYTAVGRALRSQRKNSLPGLGEVWKPNPVIRNHREVTRESVI